MLLASVGTPGKRETDIDRRTGKRTFVVRTVAEALAEARRTGNARDALEGLRARLEEFPDEPVLERLEACLEAELAGNQTPPRPAHPEADVISAEQELARRRREELGRRVAEKLDRESLLAFLSDLEADSAVAAALESFFAPLARWRPEHPEGSSRADEMAVRALALLDDPDRPSKPELFSKLVFAYQAENRSRARMRWLLRGLGAHPETPLFRELLVTSYVEQGRLQEAFLVLGTALAEEPDNLELWRERARMAGWLSLHAAEIEARERLIADNDTPAARERLIDLYTFAGRPGEAVPHALALARESHDPDVKERPVMLALQAGDVDRAFELLERLAQEGNDEWYWRERIVTYAWQDQRVERVVKELDRLRKRYPQGTYEQRLESIYRRRNLTGPLLGLLEERLAQQPDNDALETEVMMLHSALGHTERVKQILLARIQRDREPRNFFAELSTYRALKLPGLDAIMQKKAEDERLREEDAAFVLDRLQPLLEDPAARRAARKIALRFPDDPLAREVLVQLIDAEPTDLARAEAAAALARRHPGNGHLLQAWIDRAAWAGALDSQIEAREMLRQRAPGDLDNLRALADLYVAGARPEEAVVLWRALAAREGLESDATLHLIEALFATGEYDEAVAWLEKRANLPSATLENRLEVAEQLFRTERYDRALRFYMAVLDEAPSQPRALLRAGQIRSWTNDPRGAIPFLEKRLAATDEAAAETRFYLGEAYWSMGEPEKGRRYHSLALEELSAREERTLAQDVMVAKMLARFGRIDEARPIFERVLAALPDDFHLILDYADSMAAIRDVGKARELVDRAKAIQPRKARTMQMDGKVLMLERRYEDAAEVFEESMRLHGPDAGTQSDLGRAQELAGRWRSASQAYSRSLKLQPENRDVSAALQRLADEVAGLLYGSGAYRTAGEDSFLELWAQLSTPLAGERTRVGGALGFTRYRGRADAVNSGTTDVETDVVHAQLSVFHRFRRQDTIAGGIDAYPGATGDLPLGAWAGLRLLSTDPYRALDVYLQGNRLLEEPAAAPGLGGRTSGIRAAYEQDLGKRLWGRAALSYESLSLEDPAGGTVRNGYFRGVATLGWRILEGGRRVADPLALTESALPGLVGAQLEGSPRETVGPMVSAWLSYEAIRLLDDQRLAALVPIGTSFDYLTLGASGDFHLARGWGGKVEAYAGYDLANDDPIFGLLAGVTWRPSRQTELTCVGGYGTALGRSDNADSFLFRLGFAYRW